jgi:ABC-type antimicrobial peptide transport system permease subunit
MALGVQRGDVVGMVMRETLWLVLIGAGVGLPAALLASRLVSSVLFGLTPSDPLTVAMTTFLVAAVTALAGYLPARRASRVQPMAALRYE